MAAEIPRSDPINCMSPAQPRLTADLSAIARARSARALKFGSIMGVEDRACEVGFEFMRVLFGEGG